MLAKSWKKILLIILIVLCFINAIIKLTKVISFKATLETLKSSITTSQNNEVKK